MKTHLFTHTAMLNSENAIVQAKVKYMLLHLCKLSGNFVKGIGVGLGMQVFYCQSKLVLVVVMLLHMVERAVLSPVMFVLSRGH